MTSAAVAMVTKTTETRTGTRGRQQMGVDDSVLFTIRGLHPDGRVGARSIQGRARFCDALK